MYHAQTLIARERDEKSRVNVPIGGVAGNYLTVTWKNLSPVPTVNTRNDEWGTTNHHISTWICFKMIGNPIDP